MVLAQRCLRPRGLCFQVQWWQVAHLRIMGLVLQEGDEGGCGGDEGEVCDDDGVGAAGSWCFMMGGMHDSHVVFSHDHSHAPAALRRGRCSGRWWCVDCSVWFDGPKCG